MEKYTQRSVQAPAGRAHVHPPSAHIAHTHLVQGVAGIHLQHPHAVQNTIFVPSSLPPQQKTRRASMHSIVWCTRCIPHTWSYPQQCGGSATEQQSKCAPGTTLAPGRAGPASGVDGVGAAKSRWGRRHQRSPQPRTPRSQRTAGDRLLGPRSPLGMRPTGTRGGQGARKPEAGKGTGTTQQGGVVKRKAEKRDEGVVKWEVGR